MKFPYELQYFKEAEFSCKCGCGKNNIDFDLVSDLHKARTISKIPFFITSACRCESHNKKVGGVENSSHLKGLAVDILADTSIKRFSILNALFFVGFSRFVVYDNFIHVDIDYSKSNKILELK